MPSPRDLKNVWLVLIILFFIPLFQLTTPLVDMGLAALSLIIANILLQIVVIVALKIIALVL